MDNTQFMQMKDEVSNIQGQVDMWCTNKAEAIQKERDEFIQFLQENTGACSSPVKTTVRTLVHLATDV